MKKALLGLGFAILSVRPAMADYYCSAAYSGGAPALSTDVILVSKNCGGTKSLRLSDVDTYILANAPGTSGQLLYNNAGLISGGSAATIKGLLSIAYTDVSGLSTVAHSGLYSDLSGKPTALSQFANDTSFITALTAPVTSVASKTGAVALASSDVGLGNVENAAASSLYTPLTRTINGHALSANVTISASDISTGTLPAAQLPAPSASSLGGIQSSAAVTHNFLTGISTSGIASKAQPACGDLSDAGSSCTVNTGTSGSTLGLLNGNLAFSGNDLFTGSFGINKNATAMPTAQTGTVAQVAGADATSARIEIDTFGAAGFVSFIRRDGTNASPTTLQANDEVGGFNAWGHNGTGVVGPRASFRTYAAQNWSSGSEGTYADVAVTPNGGSTLTESVRFENDGAMTLPATVTGGDKGAGTINAGGYYIKGSDVNAGRNTEFFGDGVDGNVTCSSPTTLTRDEYYQNLTLQSGCSINPSGFKIFVAGTLDMTAAPANAITRTGGSGGAGATAGTAGTAGAAQAAGTVGGGGVGIAGGAGSTTAGSTGTAGTAANPGMGSAGGASGAGGLGSSGAGGTSQTGGVASGSLAVSRAQADLIKGVTLLSGGASGASGGGGGGDGTAGAGGGGSGTGGAPLMIFANVINRGAGTAAGAISSQGGVGGAGGSATAGNRGGGGGAGGGGGGFIYILYNTLSGTTATGAVDASGGAGGNGGNGFGTGVGGNGGQGGKGGAFTIVNLMAGTVSHSSAAGTPSAGGSASGTTGGTGSAGTSTTGSL